MPCEFGCLRAVVIRQGPLDCPGNKVLPAHALPAAY